MARTRITTPNTKVPLPRHAREGNASPPERRRIKKPRQPPPIETQQPPPLTTETALLGLARARTELRKKLEAMTLANKGNERIDKSSRLLRQAEEQCGGIGLKGDDKKAFDEGYGVFPNRFENVFLAPFHELRSAYPSVSMRKRARKRRDKKKKKKQQQEVKGDSLEDIVKNSEDELGRLLKDEIRRTEEDKHINGGSPVVQQDQHLGERVNNFPEWNQSLLQYDDENVHVPALMMPSQASQSTHPVLPPYHYESRDASAQTDITRSTSTLRPTTGDAPERELRRQKAQRELREELPESLEEMLALARTFGADV